MGKGLGKIQQSILKVLYGINWQTGQLGGKNLFPMTNSETVKSVQELHWGNVVGITSPADEAELNRRRASISRALHTLKSVGLIGYSSGIWYLQRNDEARLKKFQRLTLQEELEKIRELDKR